MATGSLAGKVSARAASSLVSSARMLSERSELKRSAHLRFVMVENSLHAGVGAAHGGTDAHLSLLDVPGLTQRAARVQARG